MRVCTCSLMPENILCHQKVRLHTVVQRRECHGSKGGLNKDTLLVLLQCNLLPGNEPTIINHTACRLLASQNQGLSSR